MNSSYLFFQRYRQQAWSAKSSGPFDIGLWRDNRCIYLHRDRIDEAHPDTERYLFVLIKTLLWIHGANRLSINSSTQVYHSVLSLFQKGAALSFEKEFFSDLFDRDFEVFASSLDIRCDLSQAPLSLSDKGLRVGVDLGGSSIKACLAKDGKLISSTLLEWQPLDQVQIKDGQYIVQKILEAIDGLGVDEASLEVIGISTSGVVINSELYLSALYRYFDRPKECRDLISSLSSYFSCPIYMVNDGEAAALELDAQDGALAIVMGSDEGGGYLAPNKKSLDQINELAFVPVILDEDAPIDSWSKHRGCGGVYLSVRGLDYYRSLGLNDKECSEEMGKVLAHALAFYGLFYSFNKAILLGGVTSDGRRSIMEENCINEWQAIGVDMHQFAFISPAAEFRFQQALTAAKLFRE